MARNEEKAQSMLYRFREAQAAELGFKKGDRRPHLASEVHSLGDAEKWRHQIIREISQNVSKIQDSGLTDFQIRDLNDKINKLIREKRHWEYRIRELGGPDYKRIAPRLLDHDGKEVPGAPRGYKYFGRAKDLPGVRELLEQSVPDETKAARGELYRRVDADYYGYRDDEDTVLQTYEDQRAQEELSKAASAMEEEGNQEEQQHEPDEESLRILSIMAQEPVPTQQEVEAWLVRRRQQELLEKFVSDANTLSKELST
ncbi:pre-mRNA-splicing factor ISY1 [Gaertneriomyces semiglobifer]|nr:pre-mRNA-splicing factor ISY1 [Gaertneriomyces semiglobifer]